ncbi:hypothetical protein TetV_474 [Tetraselmis virus 1]|uniref:Uncharacterized protein n=1 Tax=Tetraselmis virus 1 TaxID=2060617 RepID=A0A2P0VNR7_9VIRU|nr:hypothetical protein QJ968_gp580 [Tetraselmis virus 1]AUF82556.1 hypothetical protein TetV_474 [Tetraselmis virus 1]
MTSVAEMFERINEKLYDLDARVRALERQSEDSRILEDIHSSISILADSVQEHVPSPPVENTKDKPKFPQKESAVPDSNGPPCEKHKTILTDPRFRVLF